MPINFKIMCYFPVYAEQLNDMVIDNKAGMNFHPLR
jgi:hypothetical protein